MPATSKPFAGSCLRTFMFLSMVAFTAEANAGPSPVRRILNMLQAMQKQVDREAKVAEELFDKFMCQCQSTSAKLKADIEFAKDAIPQLESSIKEATAEKAALASDIKDANEELAEAQKTLAEATELRNKENTEFKNNHNQQTADIEALRKAVAAMDRLSEGEFLQTGMAATIRRLVSSSGDLSTSDRDVISSFLAESENDQDSDGLSSSSPAEITGILKQMHETMIKDNKQLNTDEQNAQKQYNALKQAKESQITTLKSEIATKNERMNQVGLQIVEDQSTLADARKSLEANTKLFENMTNQCEARKNDYNVETSTRSQERTAIADTIQILNDDATKQLMKTTFPSASAASFLQLQVSPKQLKGEALETLQSAMPKGSSDPRLGFVALALRSKKTSFVKVLKMIDDMVALLHKEQKDDEDKHEYCKSEIRATEDEKTELTNTIADLGKAIEQSTQKSKSLSEEITAKSDSIDTLDKQVNDMTKLRKEEHAEYMETLQANHAAKDILFVAKQRLAAFYDKSFVQKTTHTKEKPKKQALRIKSLRPAKQTEKQIAKEKAQADLSALFDGAISFAQVGAESASEKDLTTAFGLRADGNKVINLITTIMADIDKEVEEMKKDEQNAQFEYENAMKESAEKRANDAKTISELEGFKAEEEAALHKMTVNSKDKNKELDGKNEYLRDLHKECDFLLKHFETRRDARTGEIDALGKAKAVLSGADASFLQLSMRKQRNLLAVKHN